MEIELNVNGEDHKVDVDPRTLLVHLVRDTLGLKGTNVGCDTSSCGACTLHLDGEAVKSCTVLAAQAAGSRVTTIEGLAPADGDGMHPMQEAFRTCHGLQCGFCTPGMVMAAVSLLDENPQPTEEEVRLGLEGNLCRCTGYHNIVAAVLAAAEGGPVIPAAFDYVRAGSTEEALSLLAEHGDDAKLLAGGHSLLPLMKLRLASPSVLIDVGRLSDLSYVRDEGDEVAVGALTRHRDVEISTVLAEHVPLLAATAAEVGDPQVRHRGTLGGSLAHGDPASDLPAAVLALGATLVVEGPAGRRSIPAADFFTGFLETALRAGEMLVEVRLPKAGGAGWSFQKMNRRAQDWAIVGVACVLGDRPGVALVNMGSTPVRASATEAALASGAAPADAAAVAADGLEPPSDLNASADYRRHLASVLVRRALVEASAR